MRLEIRCEDRLGIAQEVLEALAQRGINLQGIDVGSDGSISLNLSDLLFSELQDVMPALRRIEGVSDVRTVAYLPSEREHRELVTIRNHISQPVLSLNRSGLIEMANPAVLRLFKASMAEVHGSRIQHWLEDFDVSDCLHDLAPCSMYARLGVLVLIAELWPVIVNGSDESEPVSIVVLLRPAREATYLLDRASQNGFDQLVSQSRSMKRLVRSAARLSCLDAPLLLEGPSGCGKEQIARACHQHSKRKDKPLLMLNCAALPEQFAETELFGELRSNGSIHHGLFEQADGGTLFLDHIGEMSLPVQMKILRLIEGGSFRRVGDDSLHQVDVRIICATQYPLILLCQQGRFREDLFHRISALSLQVPGLSDRSEDILPMAYNFIDRHCALLGIDPVRLSEEAKLMLVNYTWPGNIRQLESVLLRALALLKEDEIQPNHIQLSASKSHSGYFFDSLEGSLDQCMKRYEAHLLAQLYPSYPSSRQLGRRLGISHTAIANKLREYNIGKKR